MRFLICVNRAHLWLKFRFLRLLCSFVSLVLCDTLRAPCLLRGAREEEECGVDAGEFRVEQKERGGDAGKFLLDDGAFLLVEKSRGIDDEGFFHDDAEFFLDAGRFFHDAEEFFHVEKSCGMALIRC